MESLSRPGEILKVRDAMREHGPVRYDRGAELLSARAIRPG